MLQRSLRRDDRLSSDVDPAPVDGIRFAVVPTSREFDVLFFATPDDAKDAERDIARSETVGGGGAHRRAANVVAVFPDEPERVDSYRVAAATLARLGRACAEPGHRLEPDGERLALHWGAQDSILAPVLRSAAELLTGSDLARLRECPGSPGRACGWLFVDRTKNASRIWCVGALCGNRTRAHRRYSRERDARGRGDPAPT